MALLRSLQPLPSYLSWQSFPSPSHTPRISSGPGPNPSGPHHSLMDIKLKLWFQLHPLPFCLPPTPLPARQKANRLSHCWARVLQHHHHERNQQSKRTLAHSTERHSEQPGSRKPQAGQAKDHPDHNCVLSATVTLWKEVLSGSSLQTHSHTSNLCHKGMTGRPHCAVSRTLIFVHLLKMSCWTRGWETCVLGCSRMVF